MFCLIPRNWEPLQRGEDEEDRALVEGVHPEWREVDRVIARSGAGPDAEYLVKWRLLPYSEATWESARSLALPEDRVGHAGCLRAARHVPTILHPFVNRAAS